MYVKDPESIIINPDEASSTDADQVIDYDLIYEKTYDAYYNAMEDYFNDHQNLFNNNYNSYTSASPSEPLEYASSTDAKLYTVEVASAATSSQQATEAYILDTRNILIIFACVWLAVTLYSKIKNLMINYMTKN